MEQCIRALVGLPIEKISEAELARRPCLSATETLQKTMAICSPQWAILRKSPSTTLLSHLEAWEKEKEQSDAITAMAGLSMKHQVKFLVLLTYVGPDIFGNFIVTAHSIYTSFVVR